MSSTPRSRLRVAAATLTLLAPFTVSLAPSAQAATWPCGAVAAGITRTGDLVTRVYWATSPATVGSTQTRDPGRYAGALPVASSRWAMVPDSGGADYTMSGHTVSAGRLYADTAHSATPTHVPIATGLSGVRALTASPSRTTARPLAFYGLAGDLLVRWTPTSSGWRRTSAPGFGRGRGITVIANAPSYDALLINSSSGRLLAVRVPRTSALTPRVVVVRRHTWGGFEQLVAGPCGSTGTVLVGLDADTHSAYVYTLSHVRAPGTPISSKGRAGGWTDALTTPLDPTPDPPLTVALNGA